MNQPTFLTTDSGVPFGILSPRPRQPAPTIFVFAVDMEHTLTSDYSKTGQLLAEHGYLCVSLDVPGHGADADPEEPNALIVWRNRIEQGETPVKDFTIRVSNVLDYLISNGYTNTEHVAVSGTSRGGFMATHVAAADSRFRCVAPIAPATDLIQIDEFKGMNNSAAVEALALIHLAPQVADRSLWLIIGNNDERVNTDSAIAFTRSVVQAAAERGQEADVELHVVAEAGHVTPRGSHEQAAAWLLDRMSASVTQ